MKETKLIKIHIILFAANFIFILLMPLLILGFFNKTEKTAYAEEPGIPLETYLNGNFNYPEKASFFSNQVVKKHKMPHYKQHLWWLSDYSDKKYKNFKYSKYLDLTVLRAIQESRLFNEEASLLFIRNQTRNMMDGNSTVWAGGRVDYSLSYYKNGKNIYTKNIKNDGSTPALFKDWRYILTFDSFKNTYYQGEGLYVIHIHEVMAGGYYKNEKYETTAFKDYILAFQIGDGDVLG